MMIEPMMMTSRVRVFMLVSPAQRSCCALFAGDEPPGASQPPAFSATGASFSAGAVSL